jgi:hypothetical protein
MINSIIASACILYAIICKRREKDIYFIGKNRMQRR